jgi:hypothetical protein
VSSRTVAVMKETDVMQAVSMRLFWLALPHWFLCNTCYLYALTRTPGLMVLIIICISLVKKARLTAKFAGPLITPNRFFVKARIIFIVWSWYLESCALSAQIRFQDTPGRIYGWQMSRDVFFSEYLGFPLSVLPH